MGVEPLYTDALAAKVFDKRDIVKNGIMPLAVIIQNDNGFAVEIDGSSIELLIKGERIRPVSPEEAIMRIFRRTRSPQEVRVPSPIPLPRIPISDSNQDALDDFSHKHLGTKMIEPKSLAAGFVYFPVKGFADLRADLSEAQVYIPDLYRTDTGESMIFIEIDLKPAIDARAPK